MFIKIFENLVCNCDSLTLLRIKPAKSIKNSIYRKKFKPQQLYPY